MKVNKDTLYTQYNQNGVFLLGYPVLLFYYDEFDLSIVEQLKTVFFIVLFCLFVSVLVCLISY